MRYRARITGAAISRLVALRNLAARWFAHASNTFVVWMQALGLLGAVAPDTFVVWTQVLGRFGAHTDPIRMLAHLAIPRHQPVQQTFA
jgi:hypothetical protein